MTILTRCENGCLVGYLPSVGAEVRVPLREIVGEARASLSAEELAALDGYSGDTVVGAIEVVGAGKVRKKLKQAIKKVAKSKIVKGLAKVVSKAVPPPFNVAVKAAAGAAKFAKAVKKGNPKAKKLKSAVAKAAAGKISPKKLEQLAKKAGVSASVVTDAAVIKRLATQASADPKAAATLKLASDLVSTEPAQRALATTALQASAQPGGQAFVVQTPGGELFSAVITANGSRQILDA